MFKNTRQSESYRLSPFAGSNNVCIYGSFWCTYTQAHLSANIYVTHNTYCTWANGNIGSTRIHYHMADPWFHNWHPVHKSPNKSKTKQDTICSQPQSEQMRSQPVQLRPIKTKKTKGKEMQNQENWNITWYKWTHLWHFFLPGWQVDRHEGGQIRISLHGNSYFQVFVIFLV